ncbi:methyltransferase domain-containing protein [Brachybacterium phenoliresistens]|uniref:methyltransferase domain-containing protein n=1 Tax=Brachybacterium phenoliresistens TaxID=396014 RepID=UPI0031DC9E20
MPDASQPAQPAADVVHPPIPPISGKDTPRFGSEERKQALAAAFRSQGEDYDRLRPGYPPAVIDAILRHLPEADPVRAVDLGAGTGKLSWALAAQGVEVTAVDPSEAMLESALRAGASVPRAGASVPRAGASALGTGEQALSDGASAAGRAASPSIRTRLASAEDTGLPEGSADLVTAAQAWHWFDAQAASAEAARLLGEGGMLALVWNMLDVTIPWVHRLSRIMHAGDIHREDFAPEVAAPFVLRERLVHSWEDPMPTHDVIDLARTRSYVITATPERRAKVLANLDWYLHEHLGHAPGSTIGLPYRTDLFLYARA